MPLNQSINQLFVEEIRVLRNLKMNKDKLENLFVWLVGWWFDFSGYQPLNII